MVFKKYRLKKEENVTVPPVESMDVSHFLKNLTRRYKNMVVLEVGRSARHVFAQAAGYALVGKLPVVVGPAAMLQDGADVLRDTIVGARLNVKFLITEGDVTKFWEGDVSNASSLDQMIEVFGPQCMIF